MYRLVLYSLLLLAIAGIIGSFFNLFPWNALQMLMALITVEVTCLLSNFIFEKIFKAYTNIESSTITALLLFFILPPVSQITDFYVLVIASVIAMASKYLLAFNKKHIFNPAAVASFIIGLTGLSGGIWWIVTPLMTPLILITGLLIAKKIRRFPLFFSFVLLSTLLITFRISHNQAVLAPLFQTMTSWPILFLGGFMLTEPLTTPPEKSQQIVYSLIVGALFAAKFNFGNFTASPEFALLAGNIFSFIISPKLKLKLALAEKIELAPDTYEFVFNTDKNFYFKAGQYLEWTLPHKKFDDRGNRRYFTIASAPTDKQIRLGVKMTQNRPSSFKQALNQLKPGDGLSITGLAGDFTLPKDKNKKLAFIAGGIGITPFTSMIKYLMDNNEQRDVTLFYNSATTNGFAYKEIFDAAASKINLKVFYVLSGAPEPGVNWSGIKGRLNSQLVEEKIANCKSCYYYLSGPHSMVEGYKDMLLKTGIKQANIITDYFPGF